VTEPLYSVPESTFLQQPRRMLPQAMGATPMQRDPIAELYAEYADVQRRRAALEEQQPDMSAMQEFARRQGEMGQNALLNAIAAQYAGEAFQPLQAKFLKQAEAAQQPIRMGSGMLTPTGEFIRDPEAAQERQLAGLDRREAGLRSAISSREIAAEKAELERRRIEDTRLFRESQDALRRDLAAGRGAGGGGASPYFTPVQTAQGIMSFDSRTGRIVPLVGQDNRPIVGAAFDPSTQGNITGAREEAKTRVESNAEARKNVSRADEMLGQLSDAEILLRSGPTQSGVGAAVDVAGRIVGFSPKSAQVASQLETLSGWLVSNVPRMEGPQSNYDVQVYREMAGRVGDRTIPVNERLAAIRTLRGLQTKYKALNQDKISQQQNPTNSGGFRAPPAAAIEALRRGQGSDAQFDAIFGPGAAARARGN